MNRATFVSKSSRCGTHWVAATLLVSAIGCLGSETTQPLPKPAADKTKETSEPGPGQSDQTPKASAPATQKTSVASLDEANEVAKAIEAAIAHHAQTELNGLIDLDQFADRILHGLPVSEEFRSSYRIQIAEDGGLANVLQEIMDSVKAGGDYSLVQIMDRDGVHHPMFRLLLPEGRGFNHHEIILNQDKNGKSKIVDIFVYLTGEDVSDSLRAVDLTTFLEQVPELKDSLTGAEASFAASLKSLQQIQSLAAENKGDEALKLYETLPEDLRTNKRTLLTKLGVAQRVSDEAYFQVLEEFQKHHPTEPAFLFRMLDMLAVQQRNEDVLQTADLLQQLTGDAYLSLMKVNSLLALNRMEDARTAVAAAKKVSDSRIDVYWVEMSVLLKAKDFAAVAKQLDEIAAKFGMKFNDLLAIPDYAEFVVSDEGRAWLEAQKNKPAESVPEVPAAPNEVPPAPK